MVQSTPWCAIRAGLTARHHFVLQWFFEHRLVVSVTFLNHRICGVQPQFYWGPARTCNHGTNATAISANFHSLQRDSR